MLERAYFTGVSTISLNELKEKPASQLVQAAKNDDLIVTAEGQPVALVMRIAPQSLEATQSFVRSVRALQAQAALQNAAAKNGTSGLSDAEIEAEIAASRKARR